MGTIRDRNSVDLTEAEDIKKRWQEHTEELYKKRSSWPRWPWRCDHSPRAWHPRMQNQLSLKKGHYAQRLWSWWNSSWALSDPKRWCCESAALNMPASLENSAVATGLEKSVFILIPKKGNAKECSNYHKIEKFIKAKCPPDSGDARIP